MLNIPISYILTQGYKSWSQRSFQISNTAFDYNVDFYWKSEEAVSTKEIIDMDFNSVIQFLDLFCLLLWLGNW